MSIIQRTSMMDVAGGLFRDTSVMVPFSQTLIDDATGAYQELMRAFAPYGEKAQLIRSGELEPDLGFISRRGEAGKDHKDFFHFAHDLPLHLKGELDELEWQMKPQLEVMSRLYGELNQLSFQVAHELDERFGKYFSCSLEKEVRLSAKVSRPYSTTTLRGLYYPPIVGQRGAKTHIDRSLFTMHCGDEGGHLYARNHENGKRIVSISPGKGQVVIFSGVKMWFLSRRKLKPLWHYSDTFSGQSRLALVLFVQADVPGMRIHHARDAYLGQSRSK